jgi:hypothetical protein
MDLKLKYKFIKFYIVMNEINALIIIYFFKIILSYMYNTFKRMSKKSLIKKQIVRKILYNK